MHYLLFCQLILYHYLCPSFHYNDSSAIKSCRSSRVYGPDSFSIFHLKNLGPLATGHLTALYNFLVVPPSVDLEDLISHPDPKPGKDSSQGISYLPISLLCQAVKVLEALILPSINELLSPAKDQHGFRPRHSTTSALLQLITDIETGGNHILIISPQIHALFGSIIILV